MAEDATMQASADDELGIAWWNGLSERERARWSREAGNTGRAKDAWEAFKRSQQPMADDPLRDVHEALRQTVAELRAAGITPPLTLHRAIHALTYARAKQARDQ
jgi:hypothetical protein